MKKFYYGDTVVVANPDFLCYERVGVIEDFNKNGTPFVRFKDDNTGMLIKEENLTYAKRSKKADKYILWQPESNRPPQVTYGSYDQALKVAKNMAQRHRKKFIICKLDTEVELSDFIINKL